MKTTVLDWLPWLAKKLTHEELSVLDDYVDEAIDRHVTGVARNLQSNGPWRYHDEHNHMGPLSMCGDDACAMVTDLTDALYGV